MLPMRLLIILALCLSPASLSAMDFTEACTAPGVSRELALSRKAEISDISYRLFFNLPEAKDHPVEANETIAFNFNPRSKHPLLLDFRESPELIHSVSVNGRPVKPTFIDQHIHIPYSKLNKGKNEVSVSFTAGNQSLNRSENLIYTLFVPDRARTAFPCFDQPDMKASFSLTLETPAHWQAVTNSPIQRRIDADGRATLKFAPTEPLSTYLFAFAAGPLHHEQMQFGDRTIGAFFRNPTPERTLQVHAVLKEVNDALLWLEDFTGIDYPFSKYDLVILPGFQFGGMEHTGATFYNDRIMFLPVNASADQRLRRSKLIAHETAHMWFGDLVTMRWFDDVWTKEVFANYFAAEILKSLAPEVDHDAEWNRVYASAALAEDRSQGATPIRQNLDNLSNAGLIYNNIIYNKAPVMMRKLAEITGPDNFRLGIQEYLKDFSYANADWDDLVTRLQNHSNADLRQFSKVWVYSKGLPWIQTTMQNDSIIVSQRDPLGNGNIWPQNFDIALWQEDSLRVIPVSFNSSASSFTVKIPTGVRNESVIIPNFSGKGYGVFTQSPNDLKRLCNKLTDAATYRSLPAKTRQALLLNLNELFLSKELDPELWAATALCAIENEPDQLIALPAVTYAVSTLQDIDANNREHIENRLLALSESSEVPAIKKAIVLAIASAGKSRASEETAFKIWSEHNAPYLAPRDYMELSYLCAMRAPHKADSIISAQRARLEEPDLLREFDFVARAATPRADEREKLFRSFLQPENRRTEPWTEQALMLLTHRVHADEADAYIAPALDVLPEVQQTGDIFFPARWCAAILSQQRSPEAYATLQNWLHENTDMNPLLRNKILNGAYNLIRANQ